MEEIDEKEINFESLKNLTIEDLFPKTIFYPKQKDIQIENINLSKNNHNQQDIIPDTNNIPSTNFILIDCNPKKIPFHNNEKHALYDILIEDDMIITCGSNWIKVFNYKDILEDNFRVRTGFYAENEVFHCISITEIDQSDRKVKIIAAGGSNSVIRLINFNDCVEFKQLIGHRNEINDLKFHPFERDILLSASKDFSVRMWNIFTGSQICIFGGPEGHSAEVLSIDWHLSAEYFVSSGIDGFVKIWKIEDNINLKLRESRQIKNTCELNDNIEVKDHKKYFKTLIKSSTIYSCNSIHDNYVDCVKFNGNFILAKSIDGIIKEWLPIFNSEGDYYYLVNTYNYFLTQKISYMKFSVDYHCKYLSVGNNKGSVLIFELNKFENSKEDDINYYYSVKELAAINSSTEYIIRQTAFHKEMKFMAWINDEGYIFVNDIILK